MKLSPDFKEFIQLLNENNVKYLVIGGYAVGLHGHPRLTKDIDFWVSNETENVYKLLKTLNDFGFASLGLSEKDFLNPDIVVQLGFPPNRIDLLTELAGVNFSACFEKRSEIAAEGIIVKVIDIESLKQNKRSTGRLQDLADADKLEPKRKK